MRVPVSVQTPLTPALSPREREELGISVENSCDFWFATGPRTLLPLPLGEGRGEGNSPLSILVIHQTAVFGFWHSDFTKFLALSGISV
jgi:hypothetical protein